MKQLKRILSGLFAAVMLLSVLTVPAMAAPNGAAPAANGGAIPVIRHTESRSISCASFITEPKRSAYVDRMIGKYLGDNPVLMETLKAGMPVVMMFEGASDNRDSERFALNHDTYRANAVVIVLRWDTFLGRPYIAAHMENATSIPDYPLDPSYDNGHEGYGSATAMDGIYPLFTVNHRSIYAGYQLRRSADQWYVPCMYMNADGTFALLNGTGIHFHTRMSDNVSGDPTAPYSAGCQAVGSGPAFDSYINLVSEIMPEGSVLQDATFNGFPIKAFQEEYVYAGMYVLDRYLARDLMLDFYGGNKEAVDFATSFSARSQADKNRVFENAEFYPAYLTAAVKDGTIVRKLPERIASYAGHISGEICVTGIYKINNAYWYRVLYNGETAYISARDVSGTEMNYDDVTIHSAVCPTVKAYGEAFSIAGIIGTNYNRLSSVTGYITDMDGQVESTCTINGDYYSYSLDASDGAGSYYDSLDYNLGFRKLALGQHTYRVSVTVENHYVKDGQLCSETKQLVLLDQVFNVE